MRFSPFFFVNENKTIVFFDALIRSNSFRYVFARYTFIFSSRLRTLYTTTFCALYSLGNYRFYIMALNTPTQFLCRNVSGQRGFSSRFYLTTANDWTRVPRTQFFTDYTTTRVNRESRISRFSLRSAFLHSLIHRLVVHTYLHQQARVLFYLTRLV